MSQAVVYHQLIACHKIKSCQNESFVDQAVSHRQSGFEKKNLLHTAPDSLILHSIKTSQSKSANPSRNLRACDSQFKSRGTIKCIGMPTAVGGNSSFPYCRSLFEDFLKAHSLHPLRANVI